MEQGVLKRLGPCWLLFFCVLALFLLGDPQQEIVNFDTRFALFVKDLFFYPTSIFPTIFGHPYPDYLLPGFALMYWCSLPFGHVIYTSAILPTAAASALTVVMVYRIGRLISGQLAFTSVLFLLMTYQFFLASLHVSLDLYPTFFCCWAFFCFFKQEQSSEKQRLAPYLLISIASYCFRGPIGFVMVGSVVVCSALCFQRRTLLKRYLAVSVVCFIALMAMTFFIAYLQGGKDYLIDVINMQVMQRLHRVNFPFYHYLTVLVTNYLPTSLIALGGSVFVCRAFRGQRVSFQQQAYKTLLFWVFLVLFGMSIPGEKKPRYILEIAPALALLSGFVFTLPEARLFQRVISWVFAFLPAVTIVLLWVLYLHFQHLSGVASMQQTVAVLMVVLFVLQLFCLFFLLKQSDKHSLYLLVTAVIVVALIIKSVLHPISRDFNPARAFVQVAEQARDTDTLYFYRVSKDSSDIKYFLYANYPITPAYLDQQQQLQTLPRGSYVIMPEAVYERMGRDLEARFQVSAVGHLGRRQMVLLATG